MIIYVPTGDAADTTRLPSFYDGVYRFLESCGLKPLTALCAPH